MAHTFVLYEDFCFQCGPFKWFSVVLSDEKSDM